MKRLTTSALLFLSTLSLATTAIAQPSSSPELDIPPPLGRGDVNPPLRSADVPPAPLPIPRGDIVSPVPFPQRGEVVRSPVPFPRRGERVRPVVPVPDPDRDGNIDGDDDQEAEGDEDSLQPAPPPAVPSPWELPRQARKQAEWQRASCYVKQRGAYRELRCRMPMEWVPPSSVPAAGQAAAPAAPIADLAPAVSCDDPAAQQVLQLVNQVRSQHGLAALSCDARSVAAARAHSQDMCDRGFFAHTAPDGSAPWDRLKRAGVSSFSGAAENIARGYDTPRAVHAGWMNSAGHRKNILNGAFTRIGVARVECDGTAIWTQLFYRD